jgi:hypothetical protein
MPGLMVRIKTVAKIAIIAKVIKSSTKVNDFEFWLSMLR